ncbi:MAG: hypothetical protein AAGL24_19390 [Pseudomonadota bacterium]
MLSMGATESIWHFAGYLRIDEFIDKERFEYSGNWAWNTEDIIIDSDLTELDTPFVEEAPGQEGVDYQPIVQELGPVIDADVAFAEFVRMAEAQAPSVRSAEPERFDFTPPTPGGAAEVELISATLIQEIQIPYRLIFTDEADSRGFSSYQSNSLVDLDIAFVDEDFEFIEVSSLESALIEHFENRMGGGSYASSKAISRSEGSDAEAIAAATPERAEDLSDVFEDDTLDWDDIALIEEIFGQSSPTPDEAADRIQTVAPQVAEEPGPSLDQTHSATAPGDGASDPEPRPIETPAPAEPAAAPPVPEPTPAFVQDQDADPAPVPAAPATSAEPEDDAVAASAPPADPPAPTETAEAAGFPPAEIAPAAETTEDEADPAPVPETRAEAPAEAASDPAPVQADQPQDSEPPAETLAVADTETAAETDVDADTETATAPSADPAPVVEAVEPGRADQRATVDPAPVESETEAPVQDEAAAPVEPEAPALQAAIDPEPIVGAPEEDADAEAQDETEQASDTPSEQGEPENPAPLAAADPEPGASEPEPEVDDAGSDPDADDGTLSQTVTIDGVDQTETEPEDDEQIADASAEDDDSEPAPEEQEVQDPVPQLDGVQTQAIVDGTLVEQPNTGYHDALLDRIEHTPGADLESDAAPSVSSGDNIAFNDAILGDFNEAARTLYVGEDVVDINIAIQINAENDADLVSRNTPGSSGGFDLTPGGAEPEMDGENQLSMTQETFDIGRDAGIASWGLQVIVDYAYGDVYDIKEIHQTNEIVDKDILSTQNITQSTGLYTGSNISGNVASYIDLGKSYDAIFINGSFVNANIVYQANVIYDRDIVSVSGQSETDHVTTGDNELVNHVTFEDRGLSDWTDPTQAASSVFDSLRTKTDPGLDAWNDLPGSLDGTFQVLFVSGNYYDINAIHQTNHIIDQDIAQVSADNVNSFSSGNNYSANSAQIIELQGVNDQFSSGDVYTETMLYQSELAFTSNDDVETVLNFDTKSLVTEIVAFTAGDDVGGVANANEETFGNITVVNTIDDIFSSVMS